jgi:hypothetical protein
MQVSKNHPMSSRRNTRFRKEVCKSALRNVLKLILTKNPQRGLSVDVTKSPRLKHIEIGGCAKCSSPFIGEWILVYAASFWQPKLWAVRQ